MKALLIKKPWIDLILAGEKTWELRGSSTKVRGQIALVESGSGMVVGVCDLVDVAGPLTLDELKASEALHQVPSFRQGERSRYRRPHAWVLKDARRLREPVTYKHPQGAVIWVNLSEKEMDRVIAQF